MKKNLIILACFAVFCAIVIYPPIRYGYIYPNLGDDSATHLLNMETIQIGQKIATGYNYGGILPIGFNYAGAWLIGYPMRIFSNVAHIPETAIWMWFNCLLLIMVGVALFFVTSKLFNWKLGLLALIIPTFLAGGVMEYVYWGVTFNLLNVAVFIPLFLYFMAKWLDENKVYQAVIVGLLTILISVFHTSGIYLAPLVLVALFVYLAYKLFKKQTSRKLYRPIIACLAIVILSVVSMIIVTPDTLRQIWLFIHPSSTPIDYGVVHPIYRTLSIAFQPYITSFITIPMLVIFVTCLFVLRNKWKQIDNKVKVFILGLSCLMIELGVAAYAKISTDPTRMQVDLAIVASLTTLVLLCAAIRLNNTGIWTGVVAVAIIFGLFSGFNLWFRNNSAVKEPDKQAISYLNTLDYTTYECSPTVSSWIYNLYIKEQSAEVSPLLITRNISMSPFSDSLVKEKTFVLDADFHLLKSFTDGKVIVSVYEK